ncbi:Periplasmic beta-glucosidase precursor [Tsuneonella dongtanensis]|uniref:Periplasmic beta-glucosidase n=1 Tax=Tsuneonella dongtanensis TaxID=692370 RepID=A0A1B2A943_9SPHN|nr:glycoside hydrolase family 3 N-terminal domain-containing protein [Tsuneonella dongtanensis]ANY18631.1 Periplasmic beta-glucosidase precursor [Tsuneonella dongtanensis]
MTFEARYLDAGLNTDTRADDLLARMTLDEKIAQIGGVWGRSIAEAGSVLEEVAVRVLHNGVGHITRNSMLLAPAELARNNNAIQRWLEHRTRLKIPAIMHEEGCGGLMIRGATTFPMPIGLASTFEPDLAKRIGGVIARQMQAVGAHQVLAPVLDVVRDHRWGRVEETFGEDPMLAGRMGVAYIRGAQETERGPRIACTAKHFIAYSGGQGGLNWAPADFGHRALRDTFLPPFTAAIREAGVGSVMNAYQEIDGVPCGASRELLTGLLRDELGFEGTVVSDYDTLSSLHCYHNSAVDAQEAAKQAIKAGIDIELPELDLYNDALRKALAEGEIEIADIDGAVRRILRQKFSLGLFENRYVDEGTVGLAFGCAEFVELSREVAGKSLILLKNDGPLLPLDRKIGKIALIGPAANSARLVQGAYHYPSFYEFQFGGMPDFEGDTSRTTPPRDMVFALPAAASDLAYDKASNIERPSWDEHLPPTVSIFEGLRSVAPAEVEISYLPGCSIRGDERSGLQQAVDLAREADVAILCLGGRSGLARDCTDGEFNDRVDLKLMGLQEEMLRSVVATGTPVVLVLLNGRPLDLSWAAENVGSIVEAWLPGEQGGQAIAELLYGLVNPSGRLPVSLARSVGQMPLYYNRKPSAGRSQVFGDYTDQQASPLFPFGHGLSYSEFEFSNIEVKSESYAVGDDIQLWVDVRNVSSRDGDAIVQLYVTDPVGSVTRPVLELKAFSRVPVPARECRRVAFTLPAESFAFHGIDGALAVEPGALKLKIGESSEDIHEEVEVQLSGERRILAEYSAPAFTVEIEPVD